MRKAGFVVLIFCAAALAGCRSHAKTAAAPHVVPQSTAAKMPETRVENPNATFTPAKPAADDVNGDPTRATLLADQKGWLRDAFFDFDSSSLRTDAQQNLTSSAAWLKHHQKFNVLVEGHCDERGTERYNLALGDHRAWEAKEYLTTLGMDSSKIATVSYGKDKPFDPGHDEEAWQQNRRAHLVLTAAK